MLRALLVPTVGVLPCLLLATPSLAQQGSDRTGEELYLAACATCHGVDGAGASPSQVGFDMPLPDFNDCSFASREPDGDWLAVTHRGGPERAFDSMMPAFGEALTDEELQRAVDHVRTFCGDDSWPRGELNLPRPMVTEKAYPEDEAVFTVGVTTASPVAVSGEIAYEQRFGARNQLEVIVPFGVREPVEPSDPSMESTGWAEGIGDVGLGVKRDMIHSIETGSILSLGAEVFLPTGDEADGFGTGTFVFEPFLAYGQIIPYLGFVHFQGGGEIPVDQDRAANEVFGRAAYGRSFRQGRFGRSWTPMVEVLMARELEDEADFEWDLLPQLQVTLNTRQNIMASVGVRIPLTQRDERPMEVMAYLLWDWFDGGMLEGW